MNKSNRITLVIFGIIIVLAILISLQLGGTNTSTTPGSHPQYNCCYFHSSPPEEEHPSEHFSEPEEGHPVIRS